jgi:hypothetical protein
VAAVGPINQALRHLGVMAPVGTDEFDAVGLRRYRDSETSS